jgi:hypothetical protein
MATSEPQRAPSGRGEKTSWAQIQAMVEWLEVPDNFKLINGIIQGEVVAGKKTKKSCAYKDIADYVNGKCGSNWTQKEGEARYSSYLAKYKTVKAQLLDNSGAKFCVTDEELAMGITIKGKLEEACFCFPRMDALYGSRPNVNPLVVVDSAEEGRDDLLDYQGDADIFPEDDDFDFPHVRSSSSFPSSQLSIRLPLPLLLPLLLPLPLPLPHRCSLRFRRQRSMS